MWWTVLIITSCWILEAASQTSARRDKELNLDESFWNEENPVLEAEKLLREHKENQELVKRIGSSYYQIIYPVQLRQSEKLGISTREIGAAKSPERSEYLRPDRQQSGRHFHRTSLLIKAFSHKFRLDLELNTQLLAPNLIQKHYLANGAEQITKQEVEHCYYHGTVKDYPGATAAFRTCNGVSGVIHIGNETFIIHPFYGGDLSRKHPHVIFEARAKLKQQCGNSKDTEWATRTTGFRKTKGGGGKDGRFQRASDKSSGRHNRDVKETTKYVETALILDKAMFEKRNGSRRIDVVQDAIQIANIADLYFRTLNTRVSVVYVETWASGNQIALERNEDISKTLRQLSDYNLRKLQNVGKDTIQLITGDSFSRGDTGMAFPDSVCTPKSVGVTVDLNLYEPHLSGATMAHMIGHNLGMSHDDGGEDCHCSDWHGCVMAETIVGQENVQPYKFSECSLSEYVEKIRKGRGICLLNLPNQVEDFSRCGNGVVDEGEDCDCGTLEECSETDPCCEAVTCKLKADAECASGPCCDNCQLRSRGYLCRDTTNECDLPEFCTGNSGQCPMDIYKKNGYQCGLEGYCFAGTCPTTNVQCYNFWGFGSKSSDNVCYEQFNTQGTINGHCGVDASNNLVRCEPENVKCGSLQCELGSSSPIIAGMEKLYSRTMLAMGGTEKECKVTLLKPDMPNLGLVKDGTKCGDHLICMNQTCSSIYPYIDRGKCPTNNVALECSGHGVCSNVNTCFCEQGWDGHDCAKRSNNTQTFFALGDRRQAPTPPFGGAIDPTQSSLNMETTPIPAWRKTANKTTSYVDRSGSSTMYMVIGLVSIVGGVFIMFASMALCYRRKGTVQKYDPPYMKRPVANPPLPAKPVTPNQNHLPPMQHPGGHNMAIPLNHQMAMDPSGRGAISFGNMPSYRGQRRADGQPQPPMNGPTGPGQMGHQSQEHRPDEDLGAPGHSRQPEKGILKKGGYGPIGSERDLNDRWGDESQSDNQEPLMSPGGDPERMPLASGAGSSMNDVERTLKSLSGYHEDILQALRAAASHRSNSSASLTTSDDPRKSISDGYSEYNPAPSDYTVLRTAQSRDKLGGSIGSVRGGSGANLLPPGDLSGDEGDTVPPCGPIRIRNLEDLIRQLERHSVRHTSPNGSEDIRLSETEADRHYRLDRLGLDRLERLDSIRSSSASGLDRASPNVYSNR